MAMELKHLNPQHVMDVAGRAIDEISRLRQENAELKGGHRHNHIRNVKLRKDERGKNERQHTRRTLYLQ